MIALLAVCAVLSRQQDATARVTISNPAAVERTELTRVCVPWPRGLVRELTSVRIDEDLAPCAILERWPDGSVALAQVHARVSIGARETRVLTAEPAVERTVEAGDWRWSELPPIDTEVTDPWGRPFVARLRPDSRRPIETWASTDRVRVHRLRGIHLRDTEGGSEALFAVEGWLTEFVGERRAELTVVFSNDPLPGEPVLGPARFRELAIITRSSEIQILPRFRAANLLEAPGPLPDGGWRQTLLGPSDELYLGDRTGKAFRFDLFLDADGASEGERQAAKLAVAKPLLAFAELDWVRTTGAFGSHGGPAPAPEPAAGRGDALLHEWRTEAVLSGGPFGDFGDLRESASQGSHRNGPSALHNVIRWQSAALLRLAEAALLQQTLRPTPATRPRLPPETAGWRTGLSRRAIEQPHGWTALDYEHFSVDLIHDYYWLTGDPLARRELARAGSGLLPLLEALPFRTSRGEGWCLQAGVLISRATADREMLDALLSRARELVIPGLGPGYAVSQPPHQDALGTEEPFDAPWQMAALVHGLMALWRATDAEDVRSAAVRVARAMAVDGWEGGIGPKCFVSTRSPTTFAMPVGHSPTVGTAWILVGAFALASEAADEVADRNLFRERAEFLVRAAGEPERGGVLANPWFQIWFDRKSPAR